MIAICLVIINMLRDLSREYIYVISDVHINNI